MLTPAVVAEPHVSTRRTGEWIALPSCLEEPNTQRCIAAYDTATDVEGSATGELPMVTMK